MSSGSGDWATLLAVCCLAGLGAACSSGPIPPTTRGPVEPSSQWNLDWARGAVFYEVFVRSFADSDGDGVGDLAGLASRLDYLNDGDPRTDGDLEVDALWLMPIFESPSYHGYDVVDYRAIDPEYGSSADFQTLLDEAHARGIRVIVDLVLNHTSSAHPWFREATASPAAPRRDWYVWRSDDPDWTQPWGGSRSTWHEAGKSFYYGIFWGGMPDLEWRNPAVRDEMADIARFWLDRGVDGFRLDATRHLVANGPGELQNDQPETHAFLKELSARVRRGHPEALLVGENWTDTETIATYYGDATRIRGGDELPASFDFPLAAAILEGVRDHDARPIAGALREVLRFYPPRVLDATFLTNHDQIRVATQLAGDPAASRLAAAILLTLPGTPFLYYGEEVGLQNGLGPDDREKRTPMPWTDEAPGGGFTTGDPWHPFAPGRNNSNVKAHSDDPGSLLSRYRELIRGRHRSEALRQGDLEILPSEDPALLVFLRKSPSQELLVVHNLGADAIELVPPAGLGRLTPWPGETSGAQPTGSLLCPPRATAIWAVQPHG